MTIGIYRLIFPNTNKCYIGQSVNIERRYMQHLRQLEQGTAASKLQSAYNMYGRPQLDIILDNIEASQLNRYENEAIEIFDSFHSGFNQLEHAEDIPNTPQYGTNHGNQKYTQQQLYLAIVLLGQAGICLSKIQHETGIPIETLTQVASGKLHQWLADVYPVEYAKIIRSHRNSYQVKKKNLPRVIQPSNIVYTVEHLSNFSREHNLDHSALSKVISGKQKAHKGWKLYE